MERARTVAVVGLGKIGLPLAVQISQMGFNVIGADYNTNVVDKVNLGVAPFPGEKNLDKLLEKVVSSGKFKATTNTTEAVSKSSTVIVVVPLYVDHAGKPDFTSIDEATAQIASGLKKDTLISYETTLPIGTTRNRFTVSLEQISGLKAGEAFSVVFSPERVLTGRVFEDLKKYPKLVGGIDSNSELRGTQFYSQVLEFVDRPDLQRPNGVWPMGSSEAAELAKLAETTYRDVNIGLANQFALFADSNGIDIHKVIEASNSQPYSHIHTPGIAVGGHCIPIYPQMYLWTDPAATIVKAARNANSIMPEKCVEKLEEIHGSLEQSIVAVLGASYRGGVKETAFSGIFPVVSALNSRGAKALVHDPLYTDTELKELGFEPYHLGESVDAIIVQANHEMYKDFTEKMFPNVRTVVDGRGILKQDLWKGTKLHLIGRG